MKPLLPFLLALSVSVVHATANDCVFRQSFPDRNRSNSLIDNDNWLDLSYRSVSLADTPRTRPLQYRAANTATDSRPAAGGEGELLRLQAPDPLDGRNRNLSFLLNQRLRADGIVIQRNGKLLVEHFWNGQNPSAPRPLLDLNRPLLVLLAASEIARGRLSADKAVGRNLPEFAKLQGLRKLSLQTLLEGEHRFALSDEESSDWLHRSGWLGDWRNSDVRAWVLADERWKRPLDGRAGAAFRMEPDLDLLTMIVSKGYSTSPGQLFCERMFERHPPRDNLIWLTDAQGQPLGGGFGLSLHDLATLGQALISARNSKGKAAVPDWLLETLVASPGMRKSRDASLNGLPAGSERRYGFIHVGSVPNRVALIGGHGNSLYIDFDRRLSVAIYASYPETSSPAMLATLNAVWQGLQGIDTNQQGASR